MSSRIFRMWRVLAMALLVTVTGALACSGVSGAEREQALAAQAAAAQTQLDTVTRDHGMQIAALTSELDAVHGEVAGLEAEAASLRAALGFQTENVERLEATLSRELDAAEQARQAAVDGARRETRWVWESRPSGAGRHVSVSGWAFDSDVELPLQAGLYTNCIDGEPGALYLWDFEVWEDGAEYSLLVGLDGGKPRRQSVWGVGDARGVLENRFGDDLWRIERLHVEVPYGEVRYSVMFDTVQLRRMFPTVAAFCGGERPSGN